MKYEYKVDIVAGDAMNLQDYLNDMSVDGWHFKSCYPVPGIEFEINVIMERVKE